MYLRGLRQNDLKDLIKDTVYINYYDNKILSFNNGFVVTFYSKEKESLEDLLDFINKSPIQEIIDLEISAHSNNKGYWILFIEMEKTDTVHKSISYLLRELKPLTGINTWKMKLFGAKKSEVYNEEKLKKYLKNI
ncbi:MAG: hypothetical protein NZZ41_00960 [Candidatus Dojkabacteria bacterium]|nr:hypothetical protein [Candidatus Dojkabacteria bacterium]